ARSAGPRDAPRLSRRDHLQRTGADAVLERHIERRDLAIGRDQQAFVAALDAQLARGARLEVARLVQPAEERAQREQHQARAPMALRDVDAQHAAVEALAQPDIEALHLVNVVADEHEWRAPVLRDAVQLEREIEEWIAAQH